VGKTRTVFAAGKCPSGILQVQAAAARAGREGGERKERKRRQIRSGDKGAVRKERKTNTEGTQMGKRRTQRATEKRKGNWRENRDTLTGTCRHNGIGRSGLQFACRRERTRLMRGADMKWRLDSPRFAICRNENAGWALPVVFSGTRACAGFIRQACVRPVEPGMKKFRRNSSEKSFLRRAEDAAGENFGGAGHPSPCAATGKNFRRMFAKKIGDGLGTGRRDKRRPRFCENGTVARGTWTDSSLSIAVDHDGRLHFVATGV